MITLYWELEFTKVLLCYIFVLFIWPSVVFRKYLKNKSITFRFCFCVTTQIVLINTVVLGLGLGYLLNKWVVNILFYGSLLFSIGKSFPPDFWLRNDLHKLTAGTLGWRSFWFALRMRFVSFLRKLCHSLWHQVRRRLPEYVLLAALVVYGVIYFSYSSLVNHSYAYSDMYTHHGWIYSLLQGEIFPNGIYPEGMHCVIFLMHTVSGLSLYSCNLFLGGIHAAVFLISVYCLMREIFRWRGTPLLVLTFFLVVALNLNNSDAVVGMSRLQGTMPGDYGLYNIFVCALFLLRFLKEDFKEEWWRDPRAWRNNDNLIVFSMSLAASIAIHYYAIMTAFFICLPFAIVFIRRILCKARLLPLVAAVRYGLVIAALPVGLALFVGIHFEGSIRWALSVVRGESTVAYNIEVSEPAVTEPPESGSPEASAKSSALLRLAGVWSTVKDKMDVLYLLYCRLLGDTPGFWAVRISVMLTGFLLAYRLACMLFRRLYAVAGVFDNYVPIIGASLFIMILYAAAYLGLPELIPYDRVPYIAYLLILMVAAMPVDMLFGVLQRFSPDWLSQTVSVICVAAICVVTLETGHYHGYLFSRLTRYPSVVDVTNSIVRTFPEHTYTIVSSTDDLYSIVPHGYHEEWLTFLKTIEQGETYYLPTEYVFVYVEKRPIVHSQNYFISGPAWLATDIYADNEILPVEASKYPEISASQITEWDALESVLDLPDSYLSYIFNRTVINSKAYKWCQDFFDLYKHEMNIYYEDEDFVCYYFRQNPYSLYNLSIWN